MNSKVVKFVAGAGKTTFSEEYMKNNKNGVYLAFNNSVVSDLKNKGYLCKTIDSFFTSFVFPKFVNVIPIISNGSKIKYIDTEVLPSNLKGIGNIKIHKDGKIFNHKNIICVSMSTDNNSLHARGYFTNSNFVKYIFSREYLNLTDDLRAGLADYIIETYPQELIEIIKSRFSFIIIDEAQDLRGYRENFAKLIFESDINLIVLGDDNQNINGGGQWFENLIADEKRNQSFRCADGVCKWIRDNLEIDIYGNSDDGKYVTISYEDVLKYDDGKRILLYDSKRGKNIPIINQWRGKKETIKKAKGETIEEDIVVIGETLNTKNRYTAITRTKKNCYSTLTNKSINKK